MSRIIKGLKKLLKFDYHNTSGLGGRHKDLSTWVGYNAFIGLVIILIYAGEILELIKYRSESNLVIIGMALIFISQLLAIKYNK